MNSNVLQIRINHKEAVLIFPHQLFENHPALSRNRSIFLVEEFLFFRQYTFHKNKLILHRASMQFYRDFLLKREYDVHYISSVDDRSDIRNLMSSLKSLGIAVIHIAALVDNWLDKRTKEAAHKEDIKVVEYDSPAFILSLSELRDYFENKTKFSQTEFYILQRKKRGLLLDTRSRPLGGKWSFDGENRLKYPIHKKPPKINFPPLSNFYIEAKEYVSQHFVNNPGEAPIDFVYPHTHDQSREWLLDFLSNRFADFGPFEDAIVAQENILNHSLLSPLMNAGLITPDEVIQTTLEYTQNHPIPLNSLEGFIRQILGWREFIRGVYEFNGTQQRKSNFWSHQKSLPASFYDGTTGIIPVDIVIKKVMTTAYAHHIERLMVVGNFMLLCSFHPHEVYRWFMELFIDAYDWVMVPNVYGMSQFADGGSMATKPYISGSNYLLKMSDYPKGNWQLVWDGLFWRFIDQHRDFFANHPRMGMLLRTYDNMPENKKASLKQVAHQFLASL